MHDDRKLLMNNELKNFEIFIPGILKTMWLQKDITLRTGHFRT